MHLKVCNDRARQTSVGSEFQSQNACLPFWAIGRYNMPHWQLQELVQEFVICAHFFIIFACFQHLPQNKLVATCPHVTMQAVAYLQQIFTYNKVSVFYIKSLLLGRICIKPAIKQVKLIWLIRNKLNYSMCFTFVTCLKVASNQSLSSQPFQMDTAYICYPVHACIDRFPLVTLHTTVLHRAQCILNA